MRFFRSTLLAAIASIASLLAIPATPAFSQAMTIFTATSVNAGSGPVTGTACLTAVDRYSNPITVSRQGGGLYIKGKPFCGQLVAGSLSAPILVPNSVTDSAPGHSYGLVIYDQTAKIATDLGAIPGIGGATFSLDTYSPAVSTATNTAFTYTVASGTPSGPCTTPAQYADSATGNLFLCIQGAWVQSVGTSLINAVTNTGTNGPATLIGRVLNIPQYTGVTLPSTGLVFATSPSTTRVASAADLAPFGTLYNSISGQAATAVSFASTPTTCGAGYSPTGVDNHGNALNCALNGSASTTTTTSTSTVGLLAGENAAAGGDGGWAMNFAPATAAGTLSSFSIDITGYAAGATITVSVNALQSGLNYTPLYEFTVPLTGNGVNTFHAGTDFGVIPVAVGNTFAVQVSVGATQIQYSTGAGQATGCGNYHPAFGQPNWDNSFPTMIVGTSYLWGSFPSQYQFNFQATVVTTTTIVATPPSIASQLVGYQPANQQRTVLYDQTFSAGTTPAEWITTGLNWSTANVAWITPGAGIENPTSANGYLNQIVLDKQYAIEQRTTRVRFQTLASGTIMGVGWVPLLDLANRETLVTLDTSAGTLSISTGWPNYSASAPAVGSSVAVGFTIVPGTVYTLILSCDHAMQTASISDPVTGATAMVTYQDNTTVGSSVNEQVDRPALVGIAGQFQVLDFTVLANAKKPHLYLIGDSITFGWRNIQANSYAYQLAQMFPTGSVISSGRIGALSASALQRCQTEVIPLKPDIVYYAFGTNDANNSGVTPLTPSAVVANLQAAVTCAKSVGAKVIIALIPPVPPGNTSGHNQSDITAYNTAILAMPNVDGFVQVNRPLSVGNDGVTQDSSKFYDGVHPYGLSVAQAIAARFLIDVPFIFD